MREIISVQLGQCGAKLGYSFWEDIFYDHGIDVDGSYRGDSDLQLERIDSFFNDAIGGRYFPRTIIVDKDLQTFDIMKNTAYSKVFEEKNMLKIKERNYWTDFLKEDYKELLDSTIKDAAEKCDSLQGFQIIHSIGGATGSGFCSHLIEELRQTFPDEMINMYSIFPSNKISDNLLENYNAAFSINRLSKLTDSVIVLDNNAAYNINTNSFKLSCPTLRDLNQVLTSAITNSTASFRFPSKINSELRQFNVNMIPIQKLNFLSVSFSPNYRRYECFRPPFLNEMLNQVFDPNNLNVSNTKSKDFISIFISFRGRLNDKEIDKQMGDFINKTNHSKYFVDGMPFDYSLRYSHYPIAPYRIQSSTSLIGNTTSFQNTFKQIQETFSLMIKKKAYFHRLELEEIEFEKTNEDLLDLISSYQEIESPIDMDD